MNKLLATVALTAASGLAQASTEINFGVSSEYVFRGIPQSNGAQVWGSFDYSFDALGVYTGLWVSNSGLAGNEEVDVYLGYALNLSDSLSFDIGAIGYFDPSAPASSVENNAGEGYLGLNWGHLNTYLYYNGGSSAVPDDESAYAEVNYYWSVLADANVRLHAGYFQGIGERFDALSEDNYIDYGVAFIKDYGDSGQIALAITATSIDEGHALIDAGYAESNRPQFTVGWSRRFGAAF